MIRLFVLGAISFLVTLMSASTVFATAYGNFSDATGTVSFLNVSDSFGLFQAPTVSVDTLRFNPSLFTTSCSNGGCGAGSNIADTVVFQVDANAGQFVDNIVLSELGDTNLSQLFGNPIAATTVTGDVFIDIFAVDGSAISVISTQALMVYTSGGSFSLANQGPGLHGWSGGLLVDLNAILQANSVTGKATLVQISIANTLTAFASTGAIASIQKKDISGLAVTVVPEPSTALLLGLGLSGLATSVNRRRDRS